MNAYHSSSFLRPRAKGSVFAVMVCLAATFFPWARMVAEEQTEEVPAASYLGFHAGLGIASVREDLVVPLGFNGPAFAVGGDYSRISSEDLFTLRFKIGVGYVKNRFSHEAGIAALEIRPSWLKKVIEEQGWGELWGGLSIPIQMNNEFLGSWDDAHLYWLTAHSLAFSCQWQKQIPDLFTASVRLESPIIGLVSRPTTYRHEKQEALNLLSYHLAEPNRNLQLVTVDTYRAILLQVLVSRDLSNSLYRLGIEFQFLSCDTPKRMQGLTALVVFQYQWRIGS